MEKDRERRFQTAEDILADLRNIEEGFPLGTKIRPRKRTFVPASIVVLPFDDLSPNKDQDIQCEGLADTLITALNQLENLYIPARTSSFSFKGREKDYQEIGKKLNVDSILEGSIQKAGTQLRIAARIIKASDGKQIWGQLYSGDEKDIFRIQDQISFAIVDKLKVNLKGAERENLKKKHTKNIEAYNLYIKGRHFWSKRTKKELQRSIEYFKRAIDMDPIYALAYAGIADAYISLGTFFIAPKEAFPRAKIAAKKALEIDEAICEAHTSLGTIYFYYDWDWEAAESAFKRAIELNPYYALAFYYYSFLMLTVGRFEESLKLASRAQELDPLSAIINTGATFTYTWLRQYDEAIERFHKILELDPYFLYGHIWLGNDYCMKGMYEEGIEELQKVLNIVEDMVYALVHLGWAFAVSGQEEEAIKVLDRLNELSKENYVSPWGRATICVALGKIDQAFEFFEKAYLDREPLFAMCLSGPWYDEVRSDPRFKVLLKKMNLSEKLPAI
jgi:TolB-like protein/Tfp pilus assembly protein PilF